MSESAQNGPATEPIMANSTTSSVIVGNDSRSLFYRLIGGFLDIIPNLKPFTASVSADEVYSDRESNDKILSTASKCNHQVKREREVDEYSDIDHSELATTSPPAAKRTKFTEPRKTPFSFFLSKVFNKYDVGDDFIDAFSRWQSANDDDHSEVVRHTLEQVLNDVMEYANTFLYQWYEREDDPDIVNLLERILHHTWFDPLVFVLHVHGRKHSCPPGMFNMIPGDATSAEDVACILCPHDAGLLKAKDMKEHLLKHSSSVMCNLSSIHDRVRSSCAVQFVGFRTLLQFYKFVFVKYHNCDPFGADLNMLVFQDEEM